MKIKVSTLKKLVKESVKRRLEENIASDLLPGADGKLASLSAKVEKFLDNLQHVTHLASLNNFYDIARALEGFSLMPRNILSRAYVDVNIFQKNEYFGLTKTKDLALVIQICFLMKFIGCIRRVPFEQRKRDR